MPISHAETTAASRAYRPMSTATSAAMDAKPVKYAQNPGHGSQPGTNLTVFLNKTK
jgi:hypothetical protein